MLTSLSFIIEQCAIFKNIYLQKVKLTLKLESSKQFIYNWGRI